uniref:Death domain-containing protein CRADD-like n=1 Tax=Saccoglossus kowalevskii TaxID=10224 RepID=A0ABM0MWH3_SACKO|nr:PREDICTED: death domain-containing protein CRADD-like [Saccoglossus kowalevskii]
MEVRHKKALNSQFVTLAEEINPEYIFPYLIEDGILTPHMALIISTGGTVYDKANRLLSVLPSRGPGAFGSFLRALGVYYPWLKDGLIAAVNTDNTQLYQPQPTPKSSQPTSSNAPSAAGMTTQMASLSVSVQSDSERVTEQQLMFVAEKMNGDWESQAIRLGFQSADVARFKNDNNGMIMQIHAMLRAWRTKKGPDATCERLKQELKDAGVDLDAYGLL